MKDFCPIHPSIRLGLCSFYRKMCASHPHLHVIRQDQRCALFFLHLCTSHILVGKALHPQEGSRPSAATSGSMPTLPVFFQEEQAGFLMSHNQHGSSGPRRRQRTRGSQLDNAKSSGQVSISNGSKGPPHKWGEDLL